MEIVENNKAGWNKLAIIGFFVALSSIGLRLLASSISPQSFYFDRATDTTLFIVGILSNLTAFALGILSVIQINVTQEKGIAFGILAFVLPLASLFGLGLFI